MSVYHERILTTKILTILAKVKNNGDICVFNRFIFIHKRLNMKHIIAIFFILISCMSINAEVRIHMEKEAGVYKVPCSVNGLKLKFIFDTGAASVCISQTYAEMMLENGYLDESDILGKSQSTIADGSNIDNVVINLRNVEIGGLSLENVLAVVVPTQNAPLLLGQSVIQRLGKVSIDGEYLVIHNANEYTEEELDAIFDEAEDLYHQRVFSGALKKYKIIYDSYGDETNPSVLYKIGFCYNSLQDNKSAQIYFLKAIDLADPNDNEDQSTLALSYYSLSNLSFQNEEYNNCIQYSLLTIEYAFDDLMIVESYNNIGESYFSLNNNSQALNYFNKAIALFEKKYLSKDLAAFQVMDYINSQIGKGASLYELNRYEEAIETLEEAKDLLKPFKDHQTYNANLNYIRALLSACYDKLTNH